MNKVVAIILSVLALIFVWIAGQYAFILLGTDGWLGSLIGASVLVILVLGVAGIAREMWFGYYTEKLGSIIAAEGLEPDEPPRIKGRIDRDIADAQFDTYKAETELEPQQWRNWYRLAVGYDHAGDRRRARKSMRDAIKKFRTSDSTVAK